MIKLALCFLALNLAAVPCFADVIPSKYDDKDPAQKQAVKARLVELGVSGSNAEHSVKQLDTDDLAFFAQNTQRIQPAGSLYWYEWVAGAAVTVIVVGLYIGLGVRWE